MIWIVFSAILVWVFWSTSGTDRKMKRNKRKADRITEAERRFKQLIHNISICEKQKIESMKLEIEYFENCFQQYFKAETWWKMIMELDKAVDDRKSK